MLQFISLPLHCVDFIFPSYLGQLETCTLSPLSKEMCPFINGSLHLPQLALTAILHPFITESLSYLKI